ncbi:carbon-nitrogen hydrolase family protein [Arthrobacter sp. ISL-30]|uniref:carbon-nitrogen hydrolase family protein n=1 Tax=Arthrobacter sp. ISL-30 TaxID=2819109 RepID=UPI001BE9DC1D|nr:carbon-nitrogen hydrolase family protein [Arthrobacter sp. ISL-30]MBT2514252.1 carbon-nitrogen hydrolase family protein [Arthrobacter sp. ISL-30]
MIALQPYVAPVLTVAAVQYNALDGGVAANAVEHVRCIEDADSHGASLVLFPELSLTGYDLRLLEGPGEWLSAEDARLTDLHEICRRTGITAVVGAPWRDPQGNPRLASLAVHPDGHVTPVYKTHLHGQEKELFVAGDGPALLKLHGWKIAFAICSDAAHPAHAVEAARLGADVYAVSALYVEGQEQRLELHLAGRSMDHAMYSILANLAGDTTLGRSCGLSGIWDPNGRRIARVGGTGRGMVVAELSVRN